MFARRKASKHWQKKLFYVPNIGRPITSSAPRVKNVVFALGRRDRKNARAEAHP
jgi:hypothetical protein